jgi:hypothetical protein
MESKDPNGDYRMKVVSRRRPYTGGLAEADNFLQLVIDLRGSKPFFPKGVYRFETFEAAQEWSWKMLTR